MTSINLEKQTLTLQLHISAWRVLYAALIDLVARGHQSAALDALRWTLREAFRQVDRPVRPGLLCIHPKRGLRGVIIPRPAGKPADWRGQKLVWWMEDESGAVHGSLREDLNILGGAPTSWAVAR